MMKITHTARRWLAMVAAVLFLTLAGCTSSTPQPLPAMGGDGAAEAPAADMAESAPEVLREQGDPLPAGDESMLIVNKTMRLEVAAADVAVEEIRKAAMARGGGITDMEAASDDSAVYPKDGERSRGLRGWLTVRVPADGFNAFVADVAEMGEVLSQSESSSDVTQQHVDLSARLKNLRAQEERVREFFDAAQHVDEMLQLEKELSRIRGDIESLDAQVKHLERKAAMVTVNIHLTEPGGDAVETVEPWGFVDAITSGLRGAVTLLNTAISLVIATAPVWIVGLIAFFPVRAWLRRCYCEVQREAGKRM